MALPPYLMPDSETRAGEATDASTPRGRRRVAIIVVVAVISACVGALVTRVTIDDSPSSTPRSSTPRNSTPTTTAVDGVYYPTGHALTVGFWRITVNDYSGSPKVRTASGWR
jgi:hypothetical protein